MNTEDLIDDDQSDLQKRISGLSNLLDRVRHIVIDFMLILGLTYSIKTMLFQMDVLNRGTKTVSTDFILLILVHFSYYVLLEYNYGLTVGKFLNKTRFVNELYEKPDFKAVLIRAIIRLIPFQFALRLFPAQRTYHDLLSKTWGVRIF